MNKHTARFTAALVLAFCLALPVGIAFGDAGDFTSSSDYSSSSYSSSDYSYSSSDYSYSSSDYGSSSDYSYSSSSYDDDYDPIDTVIGVVFCLALIAFCIYKAKRNRKKYGTTYPPSGQNRRSQPVKIQDGFDKSKLRPMPDYQQIDPNFKTSAMSEKVANLYVQLQNSWTAKDLSPMRPYMSDALYNQFDRQLDSLRNNGMTNYVDNISVLSAQCEGWFQENNTDHICMIVNTRITDYTVDARGSVIKGSRSEEKFMTYRYTLARTAGAKTAAAAAVNVTKCPSCGAPVSINKTAECPYCGSIITVNEHDWVITAIQGLQQVTR